MTPMNLRVSAAASISGKQGLIGVVSLRDGEAWTLGAQGEAGNVISVAQSPLFTAMRAGNDGNWQGLFGPDHAERIFSFAAVPDRGTRRNRRR